jgi:hypothetical protein
MASKPKQPAGPAMDLGNMRQLGVQRLIAKCGSRSNKIDMRPNWKEQPPQSSLTGNVFR